MSQIENRSRDYAPGTHPDLPPPGFSLGPVAWIKENMFGSVTNVVLTCLSLYFLWITVPGTHARLAAGENKHGVSLLTHCLGWRSA